MESAKSDGNMNRLCRPYENFLLVYLVATKPSGNFLLWHKLKVLTEKFHDAHKAFTIIRPASIYQRCKKQTFVWLRCLHADLHRFEHASYDIELQSLIRVFIPTVDDAVGHEFWHVGEQR